jgi:hypothetical protein
MIARHLLSIILPLFTFVACGTNSTEPEEAPFEMWVGTWQAAEPLYRDDRASNGGPRRSGRARRGGALA